MSPSSLSVNNDYGYDAVFSFDKWMATWCGKVSKKQYLRQAILLIFYYCILPWWSTKKCFFFFARSTRFEYKRVILGFGILLLSYCITAYNFPFGVKYIFIYFHCYFTFFFYLFSHFHLFFFLLGWELVFGGGQRRNQRDGKSFR